MSRYLPYGGFKRLKNVDGFDLNSISEKSPITYILEVDLDYLEEFYVLHNVYPLAPEKLAITYEILSDYCKNLQTSMEVGDVMKWISNLGNKTNYVIPYKIIQLCLSLGMKLPKIHEVLKFKQCDWIRNILILTLKKEWMLLIPLKKTFFKLMINCVSGKTMENLRKRINVRLANNEKDFLK